MKSIALIFLTNSETMPRSYAFADKERNIYSSFEEMSPRIQIIPVGKKQMNQEFFWIYTKILIRIPIEKVADFTS